MGQAINTYNRKKSPPTFKKNVEKLVKKCEKFLSQVESLGNECAWTDRVIEQIIEEAEKIKKKYEEF